MINTIVSMLMAAHVNPLPLALKIQKISLSEGVSPILLTRIIIIESRGNPLAVNLRTGDYGLTQINLKSHPEVSLDCAMDLECNLRAGARILKKLPRVCAYNLGSAGAKKYPEACSAYEQKLAVGG